MKTEVTIVISHGPDKATKKAIKSYITGMLDPGAPLMNPGSDAIRFHSTIDRVRVTKVGDTK